MRPSRRGVLTAAVAAVLVAVGLLVSPMALLDRLGGLLFSPWFPFVLLGLYLVRPALAWPITPLSVSANTSPTSVGSPTEASRSRRWAATSSSSACRCTSRATMSSLSAQ
jgi:hypothetical protein